jgi:hypothetical protein
MGALSLLEGACSKLNDGLSTADEVLRVLGAQQSGISPGD